MEIYLDNSATTKACSQSIDACVKIMKEQYGNPSSLHKKGFEAEKIINTAKQELSLALKCKADEIIFTSGATESNNLALIGCALANKRRGKKIITTAIEHASVKETMKYLEQIGFNIVELLPNENGEYTSELVESAVDADTIIVSAMFVNNETGLILPVQDIARRAKLKNPNLFVHVDAVQGFLRLPLSLNFSEIDLLSISGHKIYAPKGVGALYIKKGVRLIPQSYGGSQQNGMRAGTEATALISALGQAVATLKDNMENFSIHYIMLKDYLLNKLENVDGVFVNSNQNCAPHIISLAVEKIRSEVMLHFLEQYDIYISSGSACSKGKESYVLKALGYSKQYSDTCIRISFGTDTTTTHIDEFVKRLKQGILTLAKLK